MAKIKEINSASVEISNALHSLWVEKYRPKSVESLICSAEIKKFISDCIEKYDIPNMLLYGRAGTGKNSIVNVIVNNMDCNYLTINASEERGIDTIRDKVQNFANTASFMNKKKIIILNEADGLLPVAQDSLRELMETASDNCRFILTCNYINKIIAPIRSRCAEFELIPDYLDIAELLVNILDSENIKYDDDYIAVIIKNYAPDIRKIINETQKNSKCSDVLKADLINSSNNEKYDKFFDAIFSTKDVKRISELTKKMVFDEDIYVAMKDYCIEKYNSSDAVIVIADHSYKNKIVFDRDLVFLSCVFNIKDILK